MSKIQQQSDDMENESIADRNCGGDKTEFDELPLDDVFKILKNSRRRQTITYLNENGRETTLSDLAEHIAAIENDVSVRALSSDQRKRVYVNLHQCHLPKMDNMSIIRFDKHRGTIELTAAATQLNPYINGSDDSDGFRWSRVNFGVSAAGIGLLTLGVGTLPFGITDTSSALAALVIVAVCSAIQVYAESGDNS